MKNSIIAICIILVTGCSSAKNSTSPFAESGSFMIARQAPAVFSGESAKALGFMPMTTSGTEIQISRSHNTAELILNGSVIEEIDLENAQSLEPGDYSVVLKQQNPSWYASEEYFTLRGLPIPADGSRDRYLKGALGKNVLYLTSDLFLNDSSQFLPEIGGVRAVDQEAFSRLYSAISLGAKVSVKE